MNTIFQTTPALNAPAQLGVTGNNPTKATERTAAGPKVSQAADDAASLAVSTVGARLSEALQSIRMIRASINGDEQQPVENAAAAPGQVRNANLADELINLTKSQILSQSGASALGQNNQAAESFLNLLR